MSALLATTKLDAVNIMLSQLGEEPYSTLSGTVTAEVRTAEIVLDEILKDVLSMGWLFNTEEDITLQPDVNDNIIPPTDAINLTFPHYPKRKYTTRQGKIYDRDNNTFTITATLKVNLTRLFVFEDIPEAARKYVTYRAAREYQGRYLASRDVHQFTEIGEYHAMSNLQETESLERDASILDTYDIHMGVLGGRDHQRNIQP